VDPGSRLEALRTAEPYRFSPANLEQMWALAETVLSVPDQSVWLMMPTGEQETAVGAAALPKLPSSRRALLHESRSARTQTYRRWAEKELTLPFVPTAEATASVKVTRPRGDAR
jgi:4-alpha-glucanotransferase